jgi:hypothetical protein
MKRILTTILCAGLTAFMSCEPELESEGIAKGIIRYPSIEILGDAPFVLQAGTTFEDPGAKAFLGEDDITDQLESSSTVDESTPGVYKVTYSVSTVNELEQTSEVEVSRFVSVTDGNVCDVDLTGNYERSTNGIVTGVTEVACGVFASDNFFATATFTFTGLIFHVGNGELVIPEQDSPYGRYEGTGTINEDGFQFVCQLLDQPGSVTRFFIKQ